MAEFDWIDRYLRPIARSAGAMGLSNDVALLSGTPAASTIATMDTLVAGIHFLHQDPLETVGRKLVRVNTSDILCKGARPKEALLSIAIPQDFRESDFEAFCKGLGADLDLWGISLLGGDLVRTDGPLVVTLMLTGSCIRERPVGRAGARTGESLLVTGRIGGGLLGLKDAEAGEDTPYATLYRVPDIPPLSLAEVVSRFATASIDVSDGLLSDAAHIAAASHKAVRIELDLVPWIRPTRAEPDMLALATGGDDYQTLLTIPAETLPHCMEAMAEAGVTCSRIGRVEEGEGLRLHLHGQPVNPPPVTGYQH